MQANPLILSFSQSHLLASAVTLSCQLAKRAGWEKGRQIAISPSEKFRAICASAPNTIRPDQ